ncbi:hypothetical protein VDIAB_150025 [Vibrio diabolicus]|nr:hypothetical protein VDIAB_150025 [Vibrio diabolicus]
MSADIAQVVERILGKDEVGSSSLPISTSSQVYFLLILDLPIILFLVAWSIWAT